MPLHLITETYGSPAEAALDRALQRAKRAADANDPFAPVTIVPPSFPSSLHVRHLLGRRERGIVNVLVKPLPALLEVIGTGALAQQGRRPLPEAYRTEAIRAAAEAGPRQFGDLPIDGSVLRTLEQTFRQFDECDDDQLDRLSEGGGMPAYLVGRYRDYLHRTRGFYTTRDLADSATGAVQADPSALHEIGALIVYLPGEWTERQRRFLYTLVDQINVQVILGLTGDDDVDRHTLARWRRGESEDDPAVSPPALPTAQRVVQAPDAEEEVRSAVREISASILSDDPTPLYRTAVLFRQTEPYARICAEQLDAAGLRWHGSYAQTLGQSIAGRVLAGLLNLLERPAPNWPVDIAPWLAAGPIRDAEGDLAPTSRWNQLARRANLRRGPAQWRTRIDQYRAIRRDDLERLRRTGDEERPGRGAWLQSELRQIDALSDFAAGLVEFVEQLPQQARWSEFAAAVRLQFHRLLGDRTAFAQAGFVGDDDLELARWDDVLSLLSSFDALDELGPAPRARFAAAVRRGLERPVGHRGRVGEGVYVGPLSASAGMSWDVVYIVGAAERALPQARREDPLLSDQLRARAKLPGSRDQLRREREQFLAALLAAPRRVISYPRADVRAQQARLPSRWLLESATALNAGERVYASRISEADRTIVAATPSFEGALTSAATPGDVQEYDLRSIRAAPDAHRHFLSRLDPALGRGIAQKRARNSGQFTRWDGWLEAGAADAAAQPHSAGGLQDWAVCPQRYFLGRVLRVEERDERGEDFEITPLDKGTLIHDILDRFFKTAEPPPAAPSSVSPPISDRERLMKIAERELDRAHARGLTGRRLLWERDRRRIIADLERFLAEEAGRRALGAWQVGSEVGFGRIADSQGMVSLTLDDGSELQLRGKIDRVERRGAGGRLWFVIDYKTGAEYPTERALNDDPIVRGTALQLPVYAHAVRQLQGLDEHVPVGSAYWFITERGKFKLNQIDWDWDRNEEFRGAVNLIISHIRGGVFPARPGGDGRSRKNNCTFCSFDEICPADRRRRWERIEMDPLLAEYVELSDDAGKY